MTERILRFVQEHPNNSILIRYEELAADPAKVMRRVLDGVQEPWHANLVDDAMANEGQLGFGDWKTLGRTGVDQSSVGRFDELTAANISSLGRIANPTLLKCGYEAVRVMPELTPEEGRRRYDLGMRLQVLRGDGGQSK